MPIRARFAPPACGWSSSRSMRSHARGAGDVAELFADSVMACVLQAGRRAGRQKSQGVERGRVWLRSEKVVAWGGVSKDKIGQGQRLHKEMGGRTKRRRVTDLVDGGRYK